MNAQNFGEPIDPSDNVEQTGLGANNLVLNPDTYADTTPVDAALIPAAPVGGVAAAVVPVDETIVPDAPAGEAVSLEAPEGANPGSSLTLLDREESELLRTRWIEIQGKFVDDPRFAVEQADALVSEAVENITRMFANEHSSLESQWKQGLSVSTEDLRKALQHYRAFFNRLVA